MLVRVLLYVCYSVKLRQVHRCELSWANVQNSFQGNLQILSINSFERDCTQGYLMIVVFFLSFYSVVLLRYAYVFLIFLNHGDEQFVYSSTLVYLCIVKCSLCPCKCWCLL